MSDKKIIFGSERPGARTVPLILFLGAAILFPGIPPREGLPAQERSGQPEEFSGENSGPVILRPGAADDGIPRGPERGGEPEERGLPVPEKAPPPKKAVPAPLQSLFDAAGALAFREKSFYADDEKGGGAFRGAFVSCEWDGFSALAGYCAENSLELRLEYLPLMNMFDLGDCRRVTRTEAPDGGWVYEFAWQPNNGKGDEQVLLTVTLSESGLSAEQKECVDSTLDSEKAILALEHLRLGVLRWSLAGAGSPESAGGAENLTCATPLFAAAEFADRLEPSPQPVSIGQRLQKKEVLPDVNFDAGTEMKITLTSCAGLDAAVSDKTTSFVMQDGVFEYKTAFAVIPAPKNADDRQLVTAALINGLPANQMVIQCFMASGLIEQAEAEIYAKEAAIAALENSYVTVPHVSSPDPYLQKELFSQRKRLERINRSIDSKIRKLRTQIGRLQKSLDAELSKRQKRNLRFFQDRFAVTYKVFLTNSRIGPDEFLLCDSFLEQAGAAPDGDRSDGGGGNGLDDADFDLEGLDLSGGAQEDDQQDQDDGEEESGDSVSFEEKKPKKTGKD